MMGHAGLGSNTLQVVFNPSTLTWTALADTGKADTFSEEGYGLLPDGRIMVIDTQHIPNTELYTSSTMTWATAGNLRSPCPMPAVWKLGHRCSDRTALWLPLAASHSAIYTFATNAWAAGPEYSE